MPNLQPELFPDFVNTDTTKVVVSETFAAKKVLRHLYQVRTKNPHNPIAPELNKIIKIARALTGATPTQIEGKILYAIEKQAAWTITEISEETGLSREIVINNLKILIENSLVIKVRRFIPGSDKPNFLFKSKRQNIGEMDDL